jgi:hypothetical protein
LTQILFWLHGYMGNGSQVACPARGASSLRPSAVYDALLSRHVEGGSARNGHPGEPGEMGRAT